MANKKNKVVDITTLSSARTKLQLPELESDGGIDAGNELIKGMTTKVSPVATIVAEEAKDEGEGKAKDEGKGKEKGKAKGGFGISRYWLLLGGGVTAIIISFILGALWQNDPTNQVLGMSVVIPFIGGSYLVYRQIKHRHDSEGGVEVNISGGKGNGKGSIPTNGKASRVIANSLVIKAKKDERSGNLVPEYISFEDIYNPDGQPMKCLNDNKFYYVQIWDIDSSKYIPYNLPDSRYVDPALMARYLVLPAQRRYLRHRESLMKFVAPGILAVAVIAGFIAIIAMTG